MLSKGGILIFLYFAAWAATTGQTVQVNQKEVSNGKYLQDDSLSTGSLISVENSHQYKDIKLPRHPDDSRSSESYEMNADSMEYYHDHPDGPTSPDAPHEVYSPGSKEPHGAGNVHETYDFGYAVHDPYHGQQYRQEQMDETGRVKGRYGYRDRKGVFRQVDYTADSFGYRANIRTNEPGILNEDPADVDIAKIYSAALPEPQSNVNHQPEHAGHEPHHASEEPSREPDSYNSQETYDGGSEQEPASYEHDGQPHGKYNSESVSAEVDRYFHKYPVSTSSHPHEGPQEPLSHSAENYGSEPDHVKYSEPDPSEPQSKPYPQHYANDNQKPPYDYKLVLLDDSKESDKVKHLQDSVDRRPVIPQRPLVTSYHPPQANPHYSYGPPKEESEAPVYHDRAARQYNRAVLTKHEDSEQEDPDSHGVPLYYIDEPKYSGKQAPGPLSVPTRAPLQEDSYDPGSHVEADPNYKSIIREVDGYFTGLDQGNVPESKPVPENHPGRQLNSGSAVYDGSSKRPYDKRLLPLNNIHRDNPVQNQGPKPLHGVHQSYPSYGTLPYAVAPLKPYEPEQNIPTRNFLQNDYIHDRQPESHLHIGPNPLRDVAHLGAGGSGGQTSQSQGIQYKPVSYMKPPGQKRTKGDMVIIIPANKHLTGAAGEDARGIGNGGSYNRSLADFPAFYHEDRRHKPGNGNDGVAFSIRTQGPGSPDEYSLQTLHRELESLQFHRRHGEYLKSQQQQPLGKTHPVPKIPVFFNPSVVKYLREFRNGVKGNRDNKKWLPISPRIKWVPATNPSTNWIPILPPKYRT